MYSLVHSQDLIGGEASQSLARSNPSEALRFFKTIPPERVGLNGDYDHSGLAKRVDRTLRQQFPAQYLEQLHITQRGRVVILTGRIQTKALLDQLVATALSVTGANQVETQGVTLLETWGDWLACPLTCELATSIKEIESERFAV